MRKMLTSSFASVMMIGLLVMSSLSFASEEIGSVSTVFRTLSPNDKIVIVAFDDQDIKGVTCYLSRAVVGGISGAVGMAEDTSDASIECKGFGQKIQLPAKVMSKSADASKVFKQSTSIWFKSMQVVRFYDDKRKALIYMVYSDKLIEGSPKNSISAVVVN
jgi:CreA protein